MLLSKLRLAAVAVTCVVGLSSTSVALACEPGTSTAHSTNSSAQAKDWHWRHHHRHHHFFHARNESGTAQSGTTSGRPCDHDGAAGTS
jgi:hypothetical protein